MSGLRIVLSRNREFDSRKRQEIFLFEAPRAGSVTYRTACPLGNGGCFPGVEATGT